MPKPVLAKLSGEIARIIKLPDMSDKLATQGVIDVGVTGTAFAIAGKGLADPGAMIAAIRMAGEIAARRADA